MFNLKITEQQKKRLFLNDHEHYHKKFHKKTVMTFPKLK